MASKIRRWLAAKLDPETAMKARKHEWLMARMHESYRWLGEFPNLTAWLEWTIEGEQNTWRPVGELPTNRWPWYGDISDFREQLRRRALSQEPSDGK